MDRMSLGALNRCLRRSDLSRKAPTKRSLRESSRSMAPTTEDTCMSRTIAIHRSTFDARLRTILLATLVVLLAACGNDAAGPTPVPPVAQVIVQPATHSMVEGDQHQYTARVFDDAGRELTGRAVSWMSTDPQVATISAEGLLTAHIPGVALIRASSESVTGDATVTVGTAPVDRVELSRATASIEEGESTTLVAIAKDAAGRILEGRPVTWTSDEPSTVAVDASGTLTGLTTGQARVVAMIEGRSAAAVVI